MLRSLALTPRASAAARASLLVLAVATASLLRAAVGGRDVAASQPGAAMVAAALTGTAFAAGARPSRPHLPALVLGLMAGIGLFALWWAASGTAVREASVSVGSLAPWAVLVAAVAVAEELVLRGVLFSAVLGAAGPAAALAVTSLVFAAMHVPLYGWVALPVDLLVGLVLGALRLLTGGVAAPAAAHVVADVLAGALG